MGLVRFNPFEDTGGNQSFALALLDAHGDGVVVSSLHARTLTRVYGKAVAGGKSEAALSDEESEALRQALASRVRVPRGPADRSWVVTPELARTARRSVASCPAIRRLHPRPGHGARTRRRRPRSTARPRGTASRAA